MDDILDRAKDLETDMKDAVDEDQSDSASSLAVLESALAELTAKVNPLAAAGAPAPKRSSSAAA